MLLVLHAIPCEVRRTALWLLRAMGGARMDIRDLDRRAGAVLGEVVMQVRTEQLWFPTPCPDWTVRGLLRHVVSENEGLAAAALNGSASIHTWNGGRLADNPAGAYRRSNVRVADAFAHGGAPDRLGGGRRVAPA